MDYDLGDKPAALAEFRKALEMDPECAQAVRHAPATLRLEDAARDCARSWKTRNFSRNCFPRSE